MTRMITEPARCQVRSGTDRPCPRPAIIKIWGVSFCEQCAHEQEAYFAIGELTTQEASRHSHDDRLLVGLLDRMRRMGRRRLVNHEHEPDAA